MKEQLRAFDAFVVLGLLITIVVIVGLIYAGNTGTASSKDCDDGNECTLDKVLPDQTCTHGALSQKSACSTCYTAGNCNGAGACTGAATACLGWCNAGDPVSSPGVNCDSHFKWDTGWVLDGGIVHAHSTRCWADRCTAYLSFYVTSDDAINTYNTSMAQCTDFLDATWLAANGTCISTERFVATTLTTDSNHVDVHACYYYWNCAVFNATWLHTRETDD